MLQLIRGKFNNELNDENEENQESIVVNETAMNIAHDVIEMLIDESLIVAIQQEGMVNHQYCQF